MLFRSPFFVDFSEYGVKITLEQVPMLEQILKSDSPLMQLARTRAQQDMARSGTTNSSMAATAGEVGMIERAQPFALQDASTHADSAKFNAGEANTFSRDANAFGREQQMANFNVKANDWAGDRSLQRNVSLNDMDYEHSLELAKLGYQNQSTQAATDKGDVLQRGYINSINAARSDYTTALANISSNSTMSSELKAETLGNLRTSYNTMITNYAKLLGWDPASWLIQADAVGATPAPTPAPAPDGPGGGE